MARIQSSQGGCARHRTAAVWLLLCLLAGTGCSTVSSRIKANQQLFNSFPSEAQEAIRQGKINIGFTDQMVIIALGVPHRVYERREQDARYHVWSYIMVYRIYDRPPLGSRRYVFRDGHGIHTVYEMGPYPWLWDEYREREIEVMRVVFDESAHVTAIEQLVPFKKTDFAEDETETTGLP